MTTMVRGRRRTRKSTTDCGSDSVEKPTKRAKRRRCPRSASAVFFESEADPRAACLSVGHGLSLTARKVKRASATISDVLFDDAIMKTLSQDGLRKSTRGGLGSRKGSRASRKKRTMPTERDTPINEGTTLDASADERIEKRNSDGCKSSSPPKRKKHGRNSLRPSSPSNVDEESDDRDQGAPSEENTTKPAAMSVRCDASDRQSQQDVRESLHASEFYREETSTAVELTDAPTTEHAPRAVDVDDDNEKRPSKISRRGTTEQSFPSLMTNGGDSSGEGDCDVVFSDGVLVGCRILKEFPDSTIVKRYEKPDPGRRVSDPKAYAVGERVVPNAMFLGTVTEYRPIVPGDSSDEETGVESSPLDRGLYRVHFDDGDVQDMDPDEACDCVALYREQRDFRARLTPRVKKRGRPPKVAPSHCLYIMGKDKVRTDASSEHAASVHVCELSGATLEAGERELSRHANRPLSHRNLQALYWERIRYFEYYEEHQMSLGAKRPSICLPPRWTKALTSEVELTPQMQPRCMALETTDAISKFPNNGSFPTHSIDGTKPLALFSEREEKEDNGRSQESPGQNDLANHGTNGSDDSEIGAREDCNSGNKKRSEACSVARIDPGCAHLTLSPSEERLREEDRTRWDEPRLDISRTEGRVGEQRSGPEEEGHRVRCTALTATEVSSKGLRSATASLSCGDGSEDQRVFDDRSKPKDATTNSSKKPANPPRPNAVLETAEVRNPVSTEQEGQTVNSDDRSNDDKGTRRIHDSLDQREAMEPVLAEAGENFDQEGSEGGTRGISGADGGDGCANVGSPPAHGISVDVIEVGANGETENVRDEVEAPTEKIDVSEKTTTACHGDGAEIMGSLAEGYARKSSQDSVADMEMTSQANPMAASNFNAVASERSFDEEEQEQVKGATNNVDGVPESLYGGESLLMTSQNGTVDTSAVSVEQTPTEFLHNKDFNHLEHSGDDQWKETLTEVLDTSQVDAYCPVDKDCEAADAAEVSLDESPVSCNASMATVPTANSANDRMVWETDAPSCHKVVNVGIERIEIDNGDWGTCDSSASTETEADTDSFCDHDGESAEQELACGERGNVCEDVVQLSGLLSSRSWQNNSTGSAAMTREDAYHKNMEKRVAISTRLTRYTRRKSEKPPSNDGSDSPKSIITYDVDAKCLQLNSVEATKTGSTKVLKCSFRRKRLAKCLTKKSGRSFGKGRFGNIQFQICSGVATPGDAASATLKLRGAGRMAYFFRGWRDRSVSCSFSGVSLSKAAKELSYWNCGRGLMTPGMNRCRAYFQLGCNPRLELLLPSLPPRTMRPMQIAPSSRSTALVKAASPASTPPSTSPASSSCVRVSGFETGKIVEVINGKHIGTVGLVKGSRGKSVLVRSWVGASFQTEEFSPGDLRVLNEGEIVKALAGCFANARRCGDNQSADETATSHSMGSEDLDLDFPLSPRALFGEGDSGDPLDAYLNEIFRDCTDAPAEDFSFAATAAASKNDIMARRERERNPAREFSGDFVSEELSPASPYRETDFNDEEPELGVSRSRNKSSDLEKQGAQKDGACSPGEVHEEEGNESPPGAKTSSVPAEPHTRTEEQQPSNRVTTFVPIDVEEPCSRGAASVSRAPVAKLDDEPVMAFVRSLKVKDLKEYLKEHGRRITGSKVELQERLYAALGAIPTDERHFPRKRGRPKKGDATGK